MTYEILDSYSATMSNLTETDIIQRINQINFWQRNNLRAPHKPLLLLMTLGRIYQLKSRLQPFSEIQDQLRSLLNSFGRAIPNQTPQEPYKRLPRNNLWEIVDENGRNLGYIPEATVTELLDTKGGFSISDYELLINDRDKILECAHVILDKHFENSWHNEILRRVNLPDRVHTSETDDEETRRHTNPNFREDILSAYERKCAICGSGIRIRDSLIDLEAAHIKWRKAGGPDIEPNGLALCIFHHKAFDRGAIGLRASNDEFLVILSKRINGDGPARGWLNNYSNKPISRPNDNRHRPDSEFVAWHYKEIFRS